MFKGGTEVAAIKMIEAIITCIAVPFVFRLVLQNYAADRAACGAITSKALWCV